MEHWSDDCFDFTMMYVRVCFVRILVAYLWWGEGGSPSTLPQNNNLRPQIKHNVDIQLYNN